MGLNRKQVDIGPRYIRQQKTIYEGRIGPTVSIF